MRLSLAYLAAFLSASLSAATSAAAADPCVRIEIPFGYNETDLREKVRYWRGLGEATGRPLFFFVLVDGKPFPVDEKAVTGKCNDKMAFALVRVNPPDPREPESVFSNYVYGDIVWNRQRILASREKGYELYFSLRSSSACGPKRDSPPEYLAFLNALVLYHTSPRATPAAAPVIAELRRMRSLRKCKDYAVTLPYQHMDTLLKHANKSRRR